MLGAAASLFGSVVKEKRKPPRELVACLRASLQELAGAAAAAAAQLAASGVSGGSAKPSEAEEHANADVRKYVEAVAAIVFGGDKDAAPPSAAAGDAAAPAAAAAAASSSSSSSSAVDEFEVEAVARALMAEEVMPLAVAALKSVAFETRKDVVALFCHLVKHDRLAFATSYLAHHAGLLCQIVDGYTSTEVALHCGAMLRECVKVPALTRALLYGPDGGLSKPVCDLFEYHVNNPNFEVASDAFESLSALMLSNKAVIVECLNPTAGAGALARYGELFTMYNRMLQSDNYVLKRQSLKLLSELLLDRANFAIMMRYIVDKANLRIIMGLLRHNQPNVQFEAFHVFKVFVANPEKPADIVEILAVNKARLISFLRGFQNDKGARAQRRAPRSARRPAPPRRAAPPLRAPRPRAPADDDQFAEEKTMLIEGLARLPDVEPATTPKPA